MLHFLSPRYFQLVDECFECGLGVFLFLHALHCFAGAGYHIHPGKDPPFCAFALASFLDARRDEGHQEASEFHIISCVGPVPF
jgi:hypothetical protein